MSCPTIIKVCIYSLLLCYVCPSIARTAQGINIVSPVNNAIIRANGSRIDVLVEIMGGSTTLGDDERIVLVVNGTERAVQSGTKFYGVEVQRGNNTLSVYRRSTTGKKLASSKVISVTILKVGRFNRP